MKKLITSSIATLLSIFALGFASVSAQSITNTGPGSNNQVITNNTTSCSSTNTNTIGIVNAGNQTSSSGSASTSGNTTGGNATSGSSSNNNSTSTSVSVNNSGCGTTTSTTPTPNTPGRGADQPGGGGRGASVQEVASIASLPATGTTPVAEVIAIGLAVTSGVGIAAYLARQYFISRIA